MANTIKLAHNATSGKTPTNLAAGEVAINSTNKKIWVGTDGTTAGQVLLFDHSIYSTDLTDNDTTYTAGSGLSLSGTVFSHSDTSSQSSINGSGRTYIQDVTLDTYGHVTGLGVATETVTNTNTTYSAGSGLNLSGTTFSHSDTSSQSSVDNSGRTYIQDVTLDTYGHVTGLASATETVTNTNTTYSAGTGLSLSGTTFSLGAAWANMSAGTRTNYTLKFQPPSSNYAGFQFLGTNGVNAGFFLIRGTSDTDVYTAEGMTLVADQGWLTLAQRSASSRGVRIMTGSSTSTERLKITTAGDIQFVNGNSLTYNGNNIATQSWVSSQGFLTSETGDIQGVTAGAGLSGGGTSGTPTLSHADTSSQASVDNSGRTYIQDVTLDTYGHVTGLASATETVTNTNTTYSAGSGLSLSGTTFSHSDTSSQSSVNGSGRTYIQDVTLDTYGHVTALGTATETVTNTNTTYSAGSGLSLSGTTFSHSDTSTQVSINLSGRQYIQDLFLDTYGHVTGYNYATETVTDTNTTYSAGAGLTLSGTTFKTDRTGTYVESEAASNLAAGWYTIAINAGNRAIGRFGLRDRAGSRHQSVIFYAAHHYGVDGSNTITVLHNSHYNISPFRYIRIKDHGTYDGAALQVYIDNSTNNVDVYLLGDNFQDSSWYLRDWIADGTDPTGVSNYSSMTEKSKVDLDQIAQGGIATTGPIYGFGDTTQYQLATQSWVNSQGFSTTTGDITGVTAGSGLTGGGTSGSVTISHNDTSSQSSVNNSGRTYIQDVTLDTYGHVTGLASATETVTNTNTTYSAGSGLSLSGTTFSHSDTSSQSSVDNSGRTYIQDVTLDTYGHVTGLSSATETVTNTDTNTTYSAGTGLSLSGTTFSVDSNVLRKTTYYNANTWLQFSGTYGLYWNSGVGAGWHIYPLNTNTMRWRAANSASQSAIRFDAGASTYGTLLFTDAGEFQVANESGDERLSIPSSGNFVRDETYTIWDSGNVTAGSGISISGNTITNTRSDTNTTYSAGSGLSLSGTTFSHTDTSSQSSVNNSGRTYIQDVTLDTYGHVTGLASATETVTNTDTNTTYSAGSGLSLSGTTFSHSDTSSQASVDNSGRTYIQDITLDTYGHVTGLASATETVTNTNTTYSAGNLLNLSGTTFSVSTASRPVWSANNQNNWDDIATTSSSQGCLEIYNNGVGNDAFMAFHCGGDYAIYFGLNADNNKLSVGGWSMGANKYEIYHSGNPSPNTTYSAGNGISLSGTTFSHADTSSSTNANNSGRTYVQSITLDTYGHVTAISSATETVTNTDTNTHREIYINGSSFLNNSSGGNAFDLRVQSPLTFTYTSAGVAIMGHESGAGNKHIPTGGSSNQYLKYASSGTATWSTIAFSHLENLSSLTALP